MPPYTSVIESIAALAVPVFWMVIVPVPGDAEVITVAATARRAVLVNDPNSPNTNPAIAMAAMSVIAMRMTVAMTGEMAFLPLTFVICMLLRPLQPLK